MKNFLSFLPIVFIRNEMKYIINKNWQENIKIKQKNNI